MENKLTLSKITFLSGIMLLLCVECAMGKNKVVLPSNSARITDEQKVGLSVMVPSKQESVSGKPSIETRLFNMEVVNVSLKELLYTLARDADVEIDIHPNINEKVSLVAHNQTFSQILARIAKMLPIRVKYDQHRVIVEADRPYHKRYKVDYLPIERSIILKTQIAPSLSKPSLDSKQVGMQDSNNSSMSLEGNLSNYFWPKLKQTLCQVLLSTSSHEHQSKCSLNSDKGEVGDVMLFPEVGMISLYGTDKQHQHITELLSDIQNRAGRQVLIEATIVEVELNEGYEAGVDWSLVLGDGMKMGGNLLANNLAVPPFVFFSQQGSHHLQGMIKALEIFGHTKVLSSPRVIALNNQPAVLKVVNEEVYFTVEVKEELGRHKETKHRKFESRLHTVPIGLVMNVTPQIGETGIVSLHVRPSITSIGGYKDDPAVSLSAAEQKVTVKSQVPVLQVREFDSMLSIPDQHIAILGGLIRDNHQKSHEGVPFLARLPVVGTIFRYQQQRHKKSELIIFLRPRIVDYGSTKMVMERHLAQEVSIPFSEKERNKYGSK